MEEMHRARYGGSMKLPCPLLVHYSPQISMYSPIQKFFEIRTFGIFVEALSHKHDLSSFPFPVLLPSQENGIGAENSKLLIIAYSSGNQPLPRTYPRVH